MRTRFKILCMVELLHDYYADQQCRDFHIIPSEETISLLRNRQMIWRVTGNKLLILVKAKADDPDKDKLLIPLHPQDKFLFYLHLNKVQFNTTTNLDIDMLREGRRFYFSNSGQNNLDDNLNLTQKIVPVAGTTNYKPGDLSADGAGDVYECISKATNPPVSSSWHKRGKQQYVSARDMVTVKTRTENYTVSTEATEFNIQVLGFNIASNEYDKLIPLPENKIITGENTKNVQIKLAGLPPGRYKLKINADEFDVFIDDTAVYNNVYGVMEIFSHYADGTAFSFLDADKKVKDQFPGSTSTWLRYTIRFANRLAFWKYITVRNGVSAIDGGAHSFVLTAAAPGGKNYFTSSKPIPLLETPRQFKVNVDKLSNDDDPLAPNPDPNQSGMLSRTETEKDFYCTINLNY